jgi:hypothetical protein
MSQAFTTVLYRSKQLLTYRKIIFHHKPFAVKSAAEFILKTKQIDKPYTAANVGLCLRDLRIINIAATRLDNLKRRVFDDANKEHADLLVQVWTCLMPDARWPGLKSPDWSLVGFQGQDPSTDFRGMGLLGLIQLAWFSQNDTECARAVLKTSSHERRYFPFAATSIVMTSLVVDLLRDQRLHHMLVASLEEATLSSPILAHAAPAWSFATEARDAAATVPSSDETSGETRQAAVLLERLHRNLQAMDQLNAPQWKAKQRATYINSIPITPDCLLEAVFAALAASAMYAV